MTVQIDCLPTNQTEIQQHRSNPGLVRDYILNLPEGLSLFYLCSVVLGYDDLDPYVHGTLCDFLVNPVYGRFRDATVPRSFFKTSVATIGKAIWLPIRRDRNIKILIGMNTADNAEKRINTIRNHWQTNILLQSAFPELVPDFKKVRWSNQCCELARTKHSDEGTYEAIGAGGAVVSRHYDHITEDDLVYAKKDDMSGVEVQPNRDDIEKAIGWHRLVYSLFSDPNASTIDNVGTRWAPHDLKAWIRENEGNKFSFFQLKAETEERNPEWEGHGMPVWPDRFGTKALKEICESQGSYLYQTQYLNSPKDAANIVFDIAHVNFFEDIEEAPLGELEYVTIVDLASGWDDQVRGRGLCNNVVLTAGIDKAGRIWVLRYDAGKFNPDQVIDLMVAHHRQFPKTTIRPEEVQYQKAIRFYANKRMESTGYRYRIVPLEREGRANAKDDRIRNIVNTSSSGGLFLRKSMKLLIEEIEDYPDGRTKDVLDCLGYAVGILRPLRELTAKQVDENPYRLENIVKDIIDKSRSYRQYPFSEQQGYQANPLVFNNR